MRELEYYELGNGDSLGVIVNVTGQDDLSIVISEMSRLYSWASTRGPEAQVDAPEDPELSYEEGITTEWLTLEDCASLTGAQSERHAA